MTRPRTMADRKYQELLRPDRDLQLARMKDRMGELGAEEEMRQLDAVFSGWSQEAEAADYDHPVSAVLGVLADRIKTAMADLGVPAERLADVRVGSTLQEDVSAQLQPFDDGSGLVLVSDSVLSLANVYSTYAGSALTSTVAGGRLKGLFRSFRAVLAGGLGEDPFVLTGLLRYYNLHQRVYGIAAKLGLREDPAGSDVAAAINLHATLFVLGHEIAHHALGHTSAPSAFSPGEHVPVCTADEQRELDADLLGYRATVRAFDLEIAGEPAAATKLGAEGGAIHATLGALVAILVIHTTESALFVRRGCTHPPAAERAARLLGRVDKRIQQFANLFLGNMMTATKAASDFDGTTEPFDWERFFAEPRLETPLTKRYLNQIATLDRLQTMTTAKIVAGLARDEVDATGRTGQGARLAAGGDVRGALAAWGVPAEEIDFVCDERQALTFHTLVGFVCDALVARDIPKAMALPTATMAAKLVADRLG